MIKRIKQIGLSLLLSLIVLPLAAQESRWQEPADTAYIFSFLANKDMFYVPFGQNQAELNRLCELLQANIDHLRAGRMYICVSSYAASGNAQTNPQRMAYLRNNRVKSELILRAGITEQMFVTDRCISGAYGDSLRNVVVVAFPADVAKIERIAGTKAAEAVRAYYRETERRQQGGDAHQRKQQAEAARQIADKEQAQREANEQTQRKAEEETQRKAEEERNRREAEEQTRQTDEAAARNATSHTLALRANLLRWATLTPDLGVEWRISRDWSVAVDATWTSWSWDNSKRRYALWEISPAIHYYIGKQKRGYAGAIFHIGQFNYKLSDTGKQGDLQGGDIVGGYRLPIGKCLMLDFNLGFGCTHADYEKYTIIEGVRVRQGDKVTNYWGIDKAGVTLVWKLF
ncbi:MAG: DUF3575 domain-containing protein [Odoribacter sp.]